VLELLAEFWWVLLIAAALLLGFGFIWRAARNDTKHSPQYSRIKRAVDASEKQGQDRDKEGK
jgi:hypothetical protein